MTIFRLKTRLIYTESMRKKQGGERGYLALEDLRIKSKFPRSNISIREVGQSGERKNPRGRRKKRKKVRAGRLGAGLKHHLGAIDPGAKIYGAKLGARIYGAELPAKSPPSLRRAQDLGASNDGAEKCNFGASNDDAELRVQILKYYLRGLICDFF